MTDVWHVICVYLYVQPMYLIKLLTMCLSLPDRMIAKPVSCASSIVRRMRCMSHPILTGSAVEVKQNWSRLSCWAATVSRWVGDQGEHRYQVMISWLSSLGVSFHDGQGYGSTTSQRWGIQAMIRTIIQDLSDCQGREDAMDQGKDKDC